MSGSTSTDSPKVSIKVDAIYSYAGYFLKYLSPLILVPYYSHILGPQGYGQVLASLSLMSLICAIVGFGFAYSGIRELAASNTAQERSEILGRQMVGRFLLIPLALAAGLLGTYISPVMRSMPLYGFLATILGIASAFGLGWFFRGIRKFKMSVFSEAIFYPINIALVLLLVKEATDGAWVLTSLLAATIISFFITYLLVRRESTITWGSIQEGIKEIKGSTTLFLSTVSTTFLTVGSTYLLTLMIHSSEQVGYYGAAEKIISLAIQMLTPIAQVLLPTITVLQRDGKLHANTLVRKGLFLETGYGLLVLLGGALIAPLVIPLILGQKFDASIDLFRIMLLLMPFTAVKHALTIYVLIPSRREKHFMSTSGMNVFLSISLALLLVPHFGTTGMAIARVLAEMAATFFLFFLLWRDWKKDNIHPLGYLSAASSRAEP